MVLSPRIPQSAPQICPRAALRSSLAGAAISLCALLLLIASLLAFAAALLRASPELLSARAVCDRAADQLLAATDYDAAQRAAAILTSSECLAEIGRELRPEKAAPRLEPQPTPTEQERQARRAL